MNFRTPLLAAAMALSVGLSEAAPGDPIALTPSAPGLISASFTQFVDDGSLFDDFTFSPSTFSGTVSVTLTSLSGPVSFFTATLNTQTFSFFPELGQPDFSFQAQVTADQPLALEVFRAVVDVTGAPSGVGSYNAQISAAVPEPQTWALCLTGLFAVGWAARRPSSRARRTAKI